MNNQAQYMRYSLAILFTVLSSCVFAQERWAVVVGISDYAKTSYDINGSNDIDIVVPMLMRNGFDRENILTLVEAQATKHNIKNTLYGLNLQEGDIYTDGRKPILYSAYNFIFLVLFLHSQGSGPMGRASFRPPCICW